MAAIKRLNFIILLLLLISQSSKAGTIVVTSNADSGPGTLRDAITLANANGITVTDTILFNIADISVGGRTISLTSELPALTSNIIIDGSTQPGSYFGISGSKITISVLINTSVPIFKCLNLENVSNIEVYGLNLKSHSNTLDYSGVGIYCNNSKNIKIGAPGKGNVLTGWITGVGYPEGYSQPYAPSDSIFIESNIIGMLEDGNTTTYGINPYFQMDACCRYGIFFNFVSNIKIGGTTTEGNLINYVGHAIAIKNSPTTPSSNFLIISNNIIGSNISKTTCTTPLNTNYEAISLLYTNGIIITNNFILGAGRMAGINIVSSNNFIISGNSINVDINGNQCNSDFFQGIIVEFCKNGLIGGSTPAQANIIGYTSLNAGIFAFMSYGIIMSQNSTYCNHIYGSIGLLGWNNDLPPSPEPFVTVNLVTANTISGKSLPDSKIELFIDDDCPLCEGKIFLTSVMADKSGDWSYTGANVDRIVATATSSGSTSEFSRGRINPDKYPQVNYSSCGRNNGSITNVEIMSGTKWHWEDINGNIISTDTCLYNVGPGSYRLVIESGSPFCLTRTQFYEVKEISPPAVTNPAITSVSCGLPNGEISTSFNSGLYYSVWRNSNLDSIGNSFRIKNLLPGDYYLQLKLIQDTSCNVLFGPYTVSNNSGPTLFTNNVQTVSSTCGGNNGSITGFAAINVTGTPAYTWVDTLNNIVGNNADLLNVPAGKYKLKFKDQGACDTIITSYYSIPDSGKIVIDNSHIIIHPAGCTVNNGSISNIIAANAENYQWQNLSSGTAAGNTLSLYNLSAGLYQLTASNLYGCTAVSPVLNVPLSEFTPLNATNVQLQNAGCGLNNGSVRILNFDNDISFFTLKWIDSASNQPMGNAASLSGLGEGTYMLYATDTNGCQKKIYTARLAALQKPVIDYSGMIIHNDECSLSKGSISGISVSGLTGPTVFNWESNTNQQEGNALNLLNKKEGQYRLTVTDAGNCTVQSGWLNIDNTDNPLPLPVYDNQTILRNTSTTLVIKNFASGSYLMYQDPLATQLIRQNNSGEFTTGNISGDTTFYIQLISGSCKSSPVPVKIKVVDKVIVYVPSAFTPNHDGKNDLLKAVPCGPVTLGNFSIYNRWGELVFSTTNFNTGWDGTYKGKPMDTGVFVWILNARDNITGAKIEQKGSVVLIR